MKRIKLYAFLLLCWLSSVASGQVSGQSIALSNVQRFVVEVGTYAEEFSYIHTQDTRFTTDAYRPDDWAWPNSPNDVFYRFTLGRSTEVLFTAYPNNAYIVEEEPGTGLLIPVQLMDLGQETLFGGELHAGTYYVISEGRVDADGSFTNGEIETKIIGFPVRASSVENLGVLPADTSLTVTGNSRYSLNEYGGSYNDLTYIFELRHGMDFSVTLANMGLSEVDIYLLDDKKQLIASSQNSKLDVPLPPGVYCLIAEGSKGNDIISMNIETKSVAGIPNTSDSTEKNLGVLPADTSLTVTRDSRYYLNEYGSSYHDLIYIFELERYMDISVALANMGLSEVNMYLLDDTKQLIASSQNSKLEVSLSAGTYYLIAEGSKENGVISMTVETKFVDIPDTKVVIDVGNYSDSFQFGVDEQDTRRFPDTYRPADWPWENSPRDVFYRFTLETPMLILVEVTTGLGLNTGIAYCLEENPTTGSLTSIPLEDSFFFNMPVYVASLQSGTYYIVAEGPVNNNGVAIDGIITTSIAGIPQKYQVPLGSFATDIQQTLAGDTRRTSNYYGDPSRKDIYYSFDLKRSMKLSVFLNNTSDLSCLNLYLLNDKDREMASSTGGSLTVEKLPSGKYFLIVEGEDIDGNFSVDFKLETPENSIDLGKVSGTKDFSNTFDTTDSENHFGLSTNEVFYKLQLTRKMDISISNRSSINSTSASYATVIYLLDADENIIQSTQDGKAGLTVEILPAGIYYIVSEGKTQNMSIVTNISTTYNEFSQDMGNYNYIMTRTYTQTDGSDSRVHIDYFDGLGRSSASVLMGASPSGLDIVTRQDYDGLGRSSREWLPRVSGYSNGKYLTPNAFEGLSSEMYNNDTHPYSMSMYESSPLNRVVKQYGAGQDWHNSNKSVAITYKANISSNAFLNCKLYVVGGTRQKPTLTQTGNYATGQLYVTEVKDEDGNTTYEFKDKLGQVVLTRQMKENVAHDTYYVYDDFGNKCFVLPPRIQDEGITQTKLDELAYQYRYDARNRQAAKKLPGAGWNYYIYDKADRLIFSQDSIQREKSEWQFTIPDAFGRIVLTGICKDIVDVSKKSVKGVYSSTGSYKGYSIQLDGTTRNFRFPPVILSVNYFDSYTFRGAVVTGVPLAGTEYSVETGYGVQSTGTAKGLLTGTLTAQLNAADTLSPTYLFSVMYYDNRERVIQTKSNNPLTSVIDQEYLAYDFTGNVTQRKHVNQITGKTPQTEIYTYKYDHEGRLLTTTHKFNTKAEVTLVDNSYDELGRLKTDRRNGNAKLRTEYKYNVRSWMESLTNPLFSQTLYYNDERKNGLLNTPSYNGNISGMDWTGGKSYNFMYDNLSRLTNADYWEDNTCSTKLYTAYSYDKHGNMLTQYRNDNPETGFYQLTFTYQGNQLMRTDDTGTSSTIDGAMDFKDGTNTGDDYAYDPNGNLTKDFNKNIVDIQYNVLNLPSKVSFVDGNSVSYLYAADGRKLQTVHKINGTTTTTDYAGNIIYENGTLKRILVGAGYIEHNEYYFYIQDHLGNNRVVGKEDGTVVQMNDYFPFGMEFASSTDETVQPYKYNGKELDTEGGLNLYDYGARHYDPALGRFGTMDRYAEKYYSLSPYSYAANNPVNVIDINGDSLSISQSTSAADMIMAIYNGLKDGSRVSMKWNNGVLDPSSIKEQAENSDDFFLKDLYEIGSSKEMVEVSFGMDNTYQMNGQKVREYWDAPYDYNTSEFGDYYEKQLIASGEMVGKQLSGNLGQTLVPNSLSTSSGKRSTNGNIQVIINSKGSLDHRTVGIAHEFGHVLLYLRGRFFGHRDPGVDSFVYSRNDQMMKRLGYGK